MLGVMKKQRRRVSVIVVNQGKILGFHAEDPTTKQQYFFLPGGGIEEGETPIETGIRETLEETGYSVEIEKNSGIYERYDFQWDGQNYDCETWFYVGKLTSPEATLVRDAGYHRGVEWLPLSEVEQAFSYHPKILSAVKALVSGPRSTWDRYYEKMLQRPLRPLYLRGIERFGDRTGSAIDLGCGIGKEAEDLLNRGFEVYAIDKEATGIGYLTARLGETPRLHTSVKAFEEFTEFPKSDFVYSFHSLPFAPKDCFQSILKKVVASIQPKGFFVGSFFGPEDDWVKWDHVAGINEVELRQFFSDFEILELTKTEERRPSANGPEKFWQFFEMIAQKK